jgi:hypothetical protein
MAVIAQLVASGGDTTANFDFTSIPGTYEQLVIVLMGRTTESAAFSKIKVRLNNDSGASYDQLRYDLQAVSPSGGNDFAQTNADAAIIAGDTAPANAAGHSIITLPAYARAVFHKGLSAQDMNERAASSGNIDYWAFVAKWASTVAITRVTLTPSTGNFKDGTVATLYGIPAS